MTDAEIIAQLRSFHEIKGWPVLRLAADRLESVAASKRRECPVCYDTYGDCRECGGRRL